MAWRLNSILTVLIGTALYGQSGADLSSDVFDHQSLSEDQQTALASLLDDPLDLNAASVDLWFLRPAVAAAVHTAREAGRFTGWRDLERRTGLPSETVILLRTVTYLSGTKVIGELSTRLVAGSSGEKIRTRFRVDTGSWLILGTTQRRPGEYRLADRTGLSLARPGRYWQLVLGDYRLSWGSGLLLADEFPRPLGTAQLGLAPANARLRPGFSSSTTGFLRGFGSLYHRGRLLLIGGYHLEQVDLTEIDGHPRVVAYRAHTRPAPMTGERLPYLGGSLALGGWEVGGLTAGHALERTAETVAVRRQYYSMTIRRKFAGPTSGWELAHENGWQGERAANLTRLAYSSPAPQATGQLRLTMLYRRYPPGWEPLRGQLMGQRVSRGNETGWFLSWGWRRAPVNLSGYLDTYRQTTAQAPGIWADEGRESSWEAATRKGRLEIRVLSRNEQTTQAGSIIDSLGLESFQQLRTSRWYRRLSATLKVDRTTRLRLLAAQVGTNGSETSGWGAIFGVAARYRRRQGGLSVAAGAYGFNTDGWDQRIYIYEDGLPGEFGLQPLSGRGWNLSGLVGLPLGRGRVSFRGRRQWRYEEEQGKTVGQPGQYGLQLDVAL